MTATEFKNIILPAYGLIRAIAVKITGEAHVADDVAQIVMTRLWDDHSKLPVPQNVGAFLYKVTRNKCYDVLRKRPVGQFVALSEAMAVEDEDGEQESDRLANLYDEINSLNEPARAIVLMSLKGKTSMEIAAELNLTPAAVRQHLSRTRKFLRNKLQSYDK